LCIRGSRINCFTESDRAPLNVVGRISMEGRNNFDRNLAKNLELILSRSFGRRAQLYMLPARHLVSPTFVQFLGNSDIAASFDILPTVPLILVQHY